MYKLPELPYPYDALEPYIDTVTMKIHHDMHHQGYINNLNKALSNFPQLQQKPLDQLLQELDALPAEIRTAVQNNGGGTLNHSMFWLLMTPQGGGTPKGTIGEHINKRFGSFAAFQEQFNEAAKSRFGSGWAWLSLDGEGRLQISSTANQDTPISQGWKPIMGLDVWEHAYYLLYQNRRPDYINAWWHVVNWSYIDELLRKELS